MKPVVDGLKTTYDGKIDFLVYAKADEDAQIAQFANEKGVSAVPTMMLVSADGRELRRWVGTTSADDLMVAFEQSLKP